MGDGCLWNDTDGTCLAVKSEILYSGPEGESCHQEKEVVGTALIKMRNYCHPWVALRQGPWKEGKKRCLERGSHTKVRDPKVKDGP